VDREPRKRKPVEDDGDIDEEEDQDFEIGLLDDELLRDEDKDSGDEEASNEKVVRYMVRLLMYSICFCLQSAIVSMDIAGFVFQGSAEPVDFNICRQIAGID
jgi:hypothetical protein